MAKKLFYPTQSESERQKQLRIFMELKGWLVEKSHGNPYQKGWPDLLCFHPMYGTRWIEMKQSERERLTPAQIVTFTKWQKYGARIYILTGVEDYPKLWKEPNWWAWLNNHMRR